MCLGVALFALMAQAAPEERMRLSYSQAVSLALERNLDLQIGQEAVAALQAEVEVAQAQRRPRLGLSASYSFSQDNVVRSGLVGLSTGLRSTDPLTNQVLGSRISLQVPVYTGGRLESAIHEKSYLLESEKDVWTRQRQQVAFLTKRAFLKYLLARENEEVAHLSLAESKETLRYATVRRDAGKGTRFEMLQAQLAVSTHTQQVVENHSEMESRQSELATLLHFPVETNFDISESLSPTLAGAEPLPSRELKALIVLALDRRPEVAALRHRLLANQEALHGAASGMKPEFSLGLHYQVGGAGSLMYGGALLLGELSIPLYDGGVTDARMDVLEHRRLQLCSEEQRILDTIALEVKQSVLRLEDGETRLVTAKDAVEQGAEAARLAQLRFVCGVGTSLELVTAQADYANARFVLARANYEQMLALAQLNLALGVSPQ